MISSLLSVIGIIIGISIVVLLFTVGFAGGVMHLLRWTVGKIRWIIGKDK
jgi:hypothetical protein